MRKFFENPEMVINVFDSDIVTGALASAAALNAAQTAVTNGVVQLEGLDYSSSGDGSVTLSDAAIQVFEFK